MTTKIHHTVRSLSIALLAGAGLCHGYEPAAQPEPAAEYTSAPLPLARRSALNRQLLQAAEKGEAWRVRSLLDEGADVNA